MKIALPESVFRVDRLGAGAGDALDRVALVHDIVTSAFDTHFALPEYRNYHSPELDFLELLGLRAAFADCNGPQHGSLPEVALDLTTLVARALDDPAGFVDGHAYAVSVSAPEKAVDLNRFRARFDFRRSFFGKIAYTPSQPVFADTPGVVRAVLHLRRNDICGGELFAGPEGAAVPEKLRYGIQSLPLLTVAAAVRVLERELPPGARVDLVIASDGFGKLSERFRAYPAVLARLARLEAELGSAPRSERLTLRLLARFIGRDAEVTRRTLDAMHEADIVVSSRPAFPRLVTRPGRTRLVVVQP